MPLSEADAVARSSETYDGSKSLTDQYRYLRDVAIREGYASGLTYYRLAQASGLSIKQIQRICDPKESR